jgi:hypothetical protein
MCGRRFSFFSPSSFLPSITLPLYLLVPAFMSLNAAAQSAARGVEVLYVLTGSTVLTYNVDRQTGYASQEGQGVTLDSATGSAVIVPSADDHFLYVTGNNGREYLWVYATDDTGVPQVPPIQTLSLGSNFSALALDSDGTLAYAVHSSLNSKGETLASIYRFDVNPRTGILMKGTKAVATFPPNGPCEPIPYSASFTLVGFNPNGSQMYDAWSCVYYDTESATYYSTPVNRNDGALGPQTQVLYWTSGSNTSTDLVNITPTAVLFFDVPNDFSYGYSELSVYPAGGGPSPLFTCMAARLEACGYGTWETVDPSGKYVFLQVSTDTTDITRLELAHKKVVDTGNYVNGFVWAFSPDDVLIYTQDEETSNPWLYSIYVFDPTTGGVTFTGAQIGEASAVDQLVPALRR